MRLKPSSRGLRTEMWLIVDFSELGSRQQMTAVAFCRETGATYRHMQIANYSNWGWVQLPLESAPRKALQSQGQVFESRTLSKKSVASGSTCFIMFARFERNSVHELRALWIFEPFGTSEVILVVEKRPKVLPWVFCAASMASRNGIAVSLWDLYDFILFYNYFIWIYGMIGQTVHSVPLPGWLLRWSTQPPLRNC